MKLKKKIGHKYYVFSIQKDIRHTQFDTADKKTKKLI